MSILIKGMEIPKSCKDCKVYEPMDNGCWGFFCALAGKCLGEKEDILSDARDADCPLVPVPPHGDLIDADALVEFIETLYDATWDEGYASACVAILERITTSISIPAEESENKE